MRFIDLIAIAEERVVDFTMVVTRVAHKVGGDLEKEYRLVLDQQLLGALQNIELIGLRINFYKIHFLVNGTLR